MIKLISACNTDPAYLEMAGVSRASIEKYCRRHSFTHGYHQIEQTDRPASWYKLKILREELAKGNAEYCLWIDVDALIYDRHFDLALLTRSGKEIYLSRDDTNINCGVMLLRKSDFNLRLMDQLWSMTHCLNHPWWEQQALIELIAANYEGIQQKIEYVPQKTFNAYQYGLYGKQYAEGEFNLDSFVAHFPGLPMATRLEQMKELSRRPQTWHRWRRKIRKVFTLAD